MKKLIIIPLIAATLLLLTIPATMAEPWHENQTDEYGDIIIWVPPIIVDPYIPPNITLPIIPTFPIFEIIDTYDYYLWTDHGGWWYDAEKTADNTDDDLMCWAASCANALEWTGWGIVNDPNNGLLEDTDEMFQNYNYYWADDGGFMSQGWDWWFDGTVYGDLEIDPSGNYWLSYTYTTYYDEEWDKTQIMTKIDDLLHDGEAVTIGIRPVGGSGGHAITAWGFRYNTTLDDYVGIWVSDSDDNKGSNTADPPPNTLRFYDLEYDSGNSRWEMTNYGGGWYIEAVMALAPRPDETRPVANAGPNISVNEGTSHSFSGSSSTDDDSLEYRWDFDEDFLWDTAWSSSSSASHSWPDNLADPVIVSLEVYDGVLKDVDQLSVTVLNVAPTLSELSMTDVNENDVSTLTGSISDPGVLDTFTLTVDWGDGGASESFSYPAGTTSFSETHKYLDDDPTGTPSDPYTVLVTVEDNDGGSDTDSTSVTVSNVTPIVDAGPAQTVDEGEITYLSASFSDVGTLDTHTITWDFGDGTPSVSGTLTPTYVYGDDGSYTVTCTVVDDDTGSDSDTLTITVLNVAPTVTSLTSDQPNPQFILPRVHGINFTALFTDPGWLDIHTAEWDYGDGTVEAGVLIEENIYPDATGTVTGSHIYDTPGNYTVLVTVTDDDGGSGSLSMDIKVVTVEEAVADTDAYIQGLGDGNFSKNAANQKNTLGNKFSAIQNKLSENAYGAAINQLESIRSLMDGEGKDWITDPDAQHHLMMKIDDIIAYLETL